MSPQCRDFGHSVTAAIELNLWAIIGVLVCGATFNITGDDVIKILTPAIDTVLIWALAANKASAQIYLPSELRPV